VEGKTQTVIVTLNPLGVRDRGSGGTSEMSKAIKLIVLAMFLLAPLIQPLEVKADQFEPYRKYIDDFPSYSAIERERAIEELTLIVSEDVEKDYLLGMLHFIQGFEGVKTFARAQKEKPKAEDVLKDIAVQKSFRASESYYDAVESRSPGYKYIYCKYAELYRASFDGEGLKRITKRIGHAPQSENIKECKNLMEDFAESLARYGYTNLSKIIYEEAVNSWNEYPEYMLEALGDIENIFQNNRRATYWWKRCVSESKSAERKQGCLEKRKGQ
jgi:hypothetical protein